jgi:hypothetical protein
VAVDSASKAPASTDVVRNRPLPLQRSLPIGRTDDPLEHEADRVAREVLRMPAPAHEGDRCACGGVPGPGGECASCRAKRRGLQRAPAAPVPHTVAPPIVHDVLAAPGRPLDPRTRAFFEPRLGLDLGDVRVHDDATAARSAEAVNALAYTVGRDVVFAAGRHTPYTSRGRGLLAHELAHVAQQRTGRGAADSHGPGILAREPATPAGASVEERLAALERSQRIDEKWKAAQTQDDRWERIFNDTLSSWSQAVLLITECIEIARGGFTKAQIEQTEFDALVTQLLLAGASFGVAVVFEPLAAAGLALLAAKSSSAAKRIQAWAPAGESLEAGVEKIVERAENPALQVVGSAGNVVPAIPGVGKADEPPTGEAVNAEQAAAVSTPLAYLAGYLREIESQNRTIQQSFLARAVRLGNATPEEIEALDLAAQEAEYDTLLTDVANSALALEDLKAKSEIALIIERSIWAAWIERSATIAPMTTGMRGAQTSSTAVQLDVGSYVAAQLNAVGVGELAGVTLSTTAFWPHAPHDWERLLRNWAGSYSERLLR